MNNLYELSMLDTFLIIKEKNQLKDKLEKEKEIS